MNSITIATKTTSMEIRLQIAEIQASKRSSDAKAIAEGPGAEGKGASSSSSQLISVPLFFLRFWRAPAQQGAGTQL